MCDRLVCTLCLHRIVNWTYVTLNKPIPVGELDASKLSFKHHGSIRTKFNRHVQCTQIKVARVIFSTNIIINLAYLHELRLYHEGHRLTWNRN